MAKTDKNAPENKKPKLSNQPTEKAPPKKSSLGRKIAFILTIGVLAFAAWTMKMHSDTIGRKPWEWEGSDWNSYLQFSRQVAEEKTQEATQKLKDHDWEKDWKVITEKTKELWGKLARVEADIERRLSKEQEKRQQQDKSASPNPATPTVGLPLPQAAAPKSNYENALEAMREATRSYRSSGKSKEDLRRAQESFRRAQELFEASLKDIPDDQRPEVESMIQECQQYLYDCLKREKV